MIPRFLVACPGVRDTVKETRCAWPDSMSVGCVEKRDVVEGSEVAPWRLIGAYHCK